MNRGAFDFITKPLDFDDLGPTIERPLSTPPDLTFKLNVALDELSVNVVSDNIEASEFEISLVSYSE